MTIACKNLALGARSSLAKAQRILATFCGAISLCHFKEMSSTFAKSDACCSPTVANAQAEFEISWGLKTVVEQEEEMLSPRVRKSSACA
eukprot:CAMPEP_0115559122 /NCGR_PEP_ID=MMETSP0271-20121206/99798_1 /TAXON_ID=71861 /ORGANISM="Scrippsiella trochoidea, Strain CCMP3099" /LENGTH=88 /DNA_ID=CAMNT_0002993173 /DNA_START=260 /DNA_END=526 /DNA_ORIENTATION=-